MFAKTVYSEVQGPLNIDFSIMQTRTSLLYVQSRIFYNVRNKEVFFMSSIIYTKELIDKTGFLSAQLLLESRRPSVLLVLYSRHFSTRIRKWTMKETYVLANPLPL